MVDDPGAIRGIADDQVGKRLAVDEDIVYHAAALVGHQAILDLSVVKPCDLVRRHAFQPLQDPRPVEGQPAHVADVEQTDTLANRLVMPCLPMPCLADSPPGGRLAGATMKEGTGTGAGSGGKEDHY